MAMTLGSFSEHAESLAILGALFAIWTSKRILGKLESNDADLESAVTELSTKQDAIKTEITNKIDAVKTELHGEINAVDKKSEDRAVEIHHKLETIRVARDKQVTVIDEKLATLMGAHDAIQKHSGCK